jgi:hypothetical protein
MQQATRRAWIAALLLIALGAGLAGLRYQYRSESGLPAGEEVWRIRYRIAFDAQGPGSQVRAFLPMETSHTRVFRETTDRAEVSIVRLGADKGSVNREVVGVATTAGAYRLVIRQDIHMTPKRRWRRAWRSKSRRLDRAALVAEPDIEVGSAQVKKELDAIEEHAVNPNQILHAIHRRVLSLRAAATPHSAAAVLAAGAGSELGRARAMVALARAAGFPARLVTGFRLRPLDRTAPSTWVEVRHQKRWLSFHPGGAFADELPADWVPARRGALDLVGGSRISNIRLSVTIDAIDPPRWLRAPTGRWAIVDLTRLPEDMRVTLALLLILPIGGLLTAFARNVIGVKTFGTFAPALLALSFVYSDWISGTVLLFGVIGIALFGRALLDALKLLMIPRLGVVLTGVVLSLVMAISVADYLDITPTARAVILPLVIITTLTERIYVTAEEDGVRETLLRAGGTVVVGAGCFALFHWRELSTLLLGYPELHLVTVAVLILIGRYVGYKLTELWRFADLVRATPVVGSPGDEKESDE